MASPQPGLRIIVWFSQNGAGPIHYTAGGGWELKVAGLIVFFCKDGKFTGCKDTVNFGCVDFLVVS